MKVALSATSWLDDELAAPWRGEVDIDETLTLGALCDRAVAVDESYLVSVNEQLVAAAQRSTYQLSEGDQIVLIAPITAG